MASNHQEHPFSGINRVHTTLATVVLLAFWAMVAYSFRAELLPPTLAVAQSISGLGGELVESRFFQVINNTSASRAKINSVISILETDYRLIHRYLDLDMGSPISVLISPGAGPPIANGGQLILFFDGDQIHLDTAPLLLVMLIQGTGLEANNLFLAGGYALYVTEEIDRATGLGQSSEAWVLLLQQQDALLSFAQAWETTIPTSERAVYDFFRAMVQGGSFVRWVTDTYGAEAVAALLAGQRLETVTGLYFDEAQAQWLTALAAKNIRSYPCQTASLGKPWFQPICANLVP